MNQDIPVNRINNKIYLLMNGEVAAVQWFQHHKPGKGGAFMKVKAKNIRSGKIIEKTYRADAKVTQAIVETKKMQFIYKESDSFVFMDTEDYSQMNVAEQIIADKKNYLIEGNDVTLMIYENEILDIDFPPQIDVSVTEAGPGVKGNTATGATKKVIIETGMEVEVPLFIEQDERIIVDTRTGQYISRADK